MTRPGDSRHVLGAVFLSATLAACGPAPESAPTLGPGAAEALDQTLQTAVLQGQVPGAVALVVNADSVLYTGTAGDLSEDTIFQIQSMTKPVTSVALMMLKEKGLVELDHSAAQYLPRFADIQVMEGFQPSDLSFTSRPPETTLSIRHLLTHTSGIGYGFSNRTLMALSGPGRPAPDLPLLFEPGSRWAYGAGTYAVGEIVEAVGGIPLDEFLETRVFLPLGMRDTGFHLREESAARLAPLHRRVGDELQLVPQPEPYEGMVAGDGGLLSTAGDYGEFLRMLLNGGEKDGVRLLTDRSVAEMTSNQIGEVLVEEQPDAAPAVSRAFPLGAGRDKFGLGFQISTGTEPGMRHPGSCSWAGLHNTHFWADPDAGVAAVVLTQLLPFYDEGAIRLLTGFERTLYSHLQ